MSANSAQAHWLIIVLSIAPAIGLGICRFAYALVLPDMRDSLGWSYSTAGFMNTVNAAGYLAGALAAHAVIRRDGLVNTIKASAAACVSMGLQPALLRDLGLPCATPQIADRHFANAEAQLGMIR